MNVLETDHFGLSASGKLNPDRPGTGLSELVHRPLDAEGKPCPWRQAVRFDPPMPAAIPGKGYPAIRMQHDRLVMLFFSAHEIAHFREVFARQVLPTARQLAEAHGHHHVNRIWLSRIARPDHATRRKILLWLDRHQKLIDTAFPPVRA